MKKINGAWPIKRVMANLNGGTVNVTLDKKEYYSFKKSAEKYGGMSALVRILIRKHLKNESKN